MANVTRAMPSRRLLIATYHFPPDPGIGGRRWDAMSYWLRELGHEVTVLTTTAWGASVHDRYGVIRSADLTASRLLRRALARPDLPVAGKEMPVQKPAPRLLADVVVPDAYLLSWGLRAATIARRLIRERNIDCLVTSGPPHSVHLIGLLLGRRRPPWIADFRDGWRYESLRPPWPTAVQEKIDQNAERSVVRRASAVVGVTKPIANDLAQRGNVRAFHVSNGWDPRLGPLLREATFPHLDSDRVNIVHTGQLSGLRGRDPRPLFRALELVREASPEMARRLRLVLAGRLHAGELELVPKATETVHLGHLDPMASLALQREADALLLLTSTGHPSQATGKLYEYLAAGRPIIALAEDNEAARIVSETGTGITVSPDDPEQISRALLSAADGTLSDRYSPRGLDRYIYPAPAAAFAEVIEEVVSR